MITVDADFKKLQNEKNIYIYGAKSIADMVYKCLLENQCNIKGFIVSTLYDNYGEKYGLPVQLIYNVLDKKEQMCIVVAVLSKFKKEIVDMLLHFNCCNIVTLSDAYALELKKRFEVNKIEHYFDHIGYEMKMPQGIEANHAILQDYRRTVEWRMDLRMFDYFQEAIDAGAWKNNGIMAEYEQTYGKPKHIIHERELTYQSSEIIKFANIYAVKCHVDKSLKNPISYTYIQEIQAGAALTEQKICDCADNTGDNISDKNKDFSECSAIYWIWKNGKKKEYTGIYHYRRYLDISTNELLFQLESGTTLINTIPCVMYPSNKFFFVSKLLYEYDWLLMMEVIKNKKPAYFETAQKFEDGHFYLANNIFIMKTEWFDRMCEFIFAILLEIDEYYANKKFERQDRYAGYLFEALYSIFIMHHAREMDIAYTGMICIT